MNFRNRTLCLFVLQIMLLAQLFIAQHATVHFLEHGSAAAEHVHQDQNHPEQNNPDCQICLVSKSFQNALTGPAQTIPAPALQPDLAVFAPSALIQKTRAGNYLARAPPTLLS